MNKYSHSCCNLRPLLIQHFADRPPSASQSATDGVQCTLRVRFLCYVQHNKSLLCVHPNYIRILMEVIIYVIMYKIVCFIYIACMTCMYVCMHACMYACMHACMHACMYV